MTERAAGDGERRPALAEPILRGAPRDPPIRDLAIIGDRRTAALVSRDAEIVWYCPGRFDAPSVFSSLLGRKHGSWRVELPDLEPAGRSYIDESGVLQTGLGATNGNVLVTDWLTMGRPPSGILCRTVSSAPAAWKFRLSIRPDYARRAATLQPWDTAAIMIDDAGFLYASHPLATEGDDIVCNVPAGEPSWMVLADETLAVPPVAATVETWRTETLAAWSRIASPAKDGLYGREMADSLRALRLLTYEPTGGVVAAATTSLPEVPSGDRNYDYRYVWLRDAGMIASAMVRAGDGGLDEQRFLGFVCSTRGSAEALPLPPFADLDGNPAPDAQTLPLAGYRASQPVRIGNAAREQLQLDGLGNVLLAAKLIYGRKDGERPHWDTVRDLANFLAEHWSEPDQGIWEEGETLHYTSSKVIAACGLDSIAEFADDQAQAERWRQAVRDIRDFVARECLTPEGAYASFAGSEDVDVSAALFPVWAYTDPDTPEMLATITVLERDHTPDGLLLRRSLVCADAIKEGVFLAGTFWVAQYWIMRGDITKARRIIDRALAYANDLGLFAEEADPGSADMLGNFPQTFVHAAFIGAVIDLRAALGDGSSKPDQGE